MKKFVPFSIIMFSALLLFGPCSARAATTTSITQYGFTWNFKSAVEYGRFVNGDYWVVGPVVITSITPSFDGANYGWEVNPILGSTTGLQDKCSSYEFPIDLSRMPSLPYTAQPGSSIVKAAPSAAMLAGGSHRVCLQTAAVLTVLASPPAADAFRPSYIGTWKQLYYYSDVRTELIPSLVPVGSPPTLDWVRDRFKYMQIDHPSGALMRQALHAHDNFGGLDSGYGGGLGRDQATGALRLMLNDSLADKKEALVAYLQMGIDYYGNVLSGQPYSTGAGHSPGFLLPIAFFGALLGDATVQANIKAISSISEKYTVVAGIDGKGIWGLPASESAYWSNTCSTNWIERRDPYGYIDGGMTLSNTVNGYQEITTPVYKGGVLVAHLMPTVYDLFNYPVLTEYVIRWTTTGLKALPDPCAPCGGTYGVDYGPDPANPGMCIKDPDLLSYTNRPTFTCQSGQECGRFPARNGIHVDGYNSAYSSAFQRAMWDAYWGTSSQTCSQLGGSCCSSGQTCTGSFQSSSNCGSLCCVGGSCQTPTQTCGNNIREGTETCDGADLAGQTCVSRGFTGGTISCSSNCMSFDTSGRTSSQYFLPEQIVQAESGQFSSPIQAGLNSSASGGQYIYTATSYQGPASFTFNITDPGQYRMDARVLTPATSAAHDSFYIGLDDAP